MTSLSLLAGRAVHVYACDADIAIIAHHFKICIHGAILLSDVMSCDKTELFLKAIICTRKLRFTDKKGLL